MKNILILILIFHITLAQAASDSVKSMQTTLGFAQKGRTDHLIIEAKGTGLGHTVGFPTKAGWGASAEGANANGYVVWNANYSVPFEGGGNTVFHLKIDVNKPNYFDKIVNLDIYDRTSAEVIASRVLVRSDFYRTGEFLPFSLQYSTQGRSRHSLEARVYTYSGAYIEVSKIAFITDQFVEGMPRLINKSSASNAAVSDLVKRAIAGLGFEAVQGPNANDIIFVGNYYMAWIDQTGFYGKMNGLWLLNNRRGDELNFLSTQIENGRVFNFLASAENGDGKWLDGYSGGEHFEIPNYLDTKTFRNNSNAKAYGEGGDTCQDKGAGSSYQTHYSLNEAVGIIRPSLPPHWTEIGHDNNNRMAFGKLIKPLVFQDVSDGLELKYQAPLTKESRSEPYCSDMNFSHSNFLFKDGVRYPVDIIIGYRLYADRPYFDRTYRIHNGDGNPSLDGDTYMAIIYGVPFSKTTQRINQKAAIWNYVQPNQSDMTSNGYFLPYQRWTDISSTVNHTPNNGNSDFLLGWSVPTTLTFSANASYTTGQSLFVAQYSPQYPMEDNRVGICVCVNHGGYELGGGGILNGYNVGNLAGGEISAEGVKRIGFPQGRSMNNLKP